MSYDHNEAVSRLNNLLQRELLNKSAEEVTHLGADPAAAEKGFGTAQTNELKHAPGPANGITDDARNKIMTDQVTHNNISISGTDGATDTQGAKMTVNEVPESKQASLGAAFARGLVNKQASVNYAAEQADYISGTEMFQKRAAMLGAGSAEERAYAAQDFYASMPRLHANPYYGPIFEKHASIKMAEDVAAAQEAGAAGSEEDIAAALQQAVAEDPELAAELEGEITGGAIDELAAAEGEAAVVEEIAAAAGVDPEAVVEAATLIEDAAAENGMPVEDFVQVLDQALAEGAAAEAPADGVKEASMRRIAKAASMQAAPVNSDLSRAVTGLVQAYHSR